MTIDVLIQAATVIILFFTLIAIIWYTIETRWLREATINATEMVHRPLVTLSFKKDDPNLYINNAGNGNALELHCQFLNGEGQETAFEGYLDLIRANESLIFKSHVADREKPNVEDILEERLKPMSGQKPATVLITYKNMLHTSFQSVIFFDGKFLSLKSTKLLG